MSIVNLSQDMLKTRIKNVGSMPNMRLAMLLCSIFLLSLFSTSPVYATPAGDNILITETLYDTPGTDSIEEWVELYNPTGSSVNLNGWSISDNAGTFQLSGSISAGGFLVIARDSAGFNALYGFSPDLLMGSSLQLSNSGDQLILRDGSSTEVDFVAWENYVAGWSVSATFTTIQRATSVDTDTVSDWENSLTTGTPGSGSYAPPGPDTTPPTVSITTPQNGGTVFGTVTVSVTASDPSGISTYEILVDGALRSSTNSYNWDTTLETDGSHTITANAQDGAGNWGTDGITVTVDNTNPPTQTPVKVMAFNIKESGESATHPDWKLVVQEENADIIMFVETGTWDDNGNAKLNQYVSEFNTYFAGENPYSGYTTQGIGFTTSGEAIMSRYPIVSTTQISTVTLDGGSSYTVTHDFLDAVVDINGLQVHVVGGHLKCCTGATNEGRRESEQNGLNNYFDSLGNVPIIYLGDFNSFSPEDIGLNTQQSGLGYGPMSMLLGTNGYESFAPTVNAFTDVHRALNPTDLGISNPDFVSRIDFLYVSQHLTPYMVTSTTGDTAHAATGSDHYSVDVVMDFASTTDTTPPAQVVGVNAVADSDTQISLSWTANSEPDLDHYNIYRDGVFLTSSLINSFVDTGLTASTSYNYEVSAVDTSSNEGLKSSIASVTTQPPPDSIPPGQVVGLSANAVSGSQIDLSWTANSEPDLDHYNIYRNNVFVISSTTNSYSDLGLNSETTYNYEVSAVDFSGNEGTRSLVASATTPDVTPPGLVTGLSASAVSGSQINLNWNPSGASDLDHYNVYRDGLFLTQTTATSYSDLGLSSETSYNYEVSAVDTSSNEGSKSAVASATTFDITPPGQVTGLLTNVLGTDSIDLNWNLNPESDVDHYNIYRDGILIGTSMSGSFSDTGLTASTTYTYEISAVDTSGNEGLKSSPSAATTADPPIGGLTHIIISEVFYDTPGNDAQREWIEIYNPTGQTVDLTGWTLEDWQGNPFTLSGSIAPGQFIVVARDLAGFNSFYGFPADQGGFSMALGNNGDAVYLFDNNGVEVDFVAWENKSPGWSITASTGQSIARSVLNSDTDTVADWITVVNNGTPGSQ